MSSLEVMEKDFCPKNKQDISDMTVSSTSVHCIPVCNCKDEQLDMPGQLSGGLSAPEQLSPQSSKVLQEYCVMEYNFLVVRERWPSEPVCSMWKTSHVIASGRIRGWQGSDCDERRQNFSNNPQN
jgi:hypothetical protein